MMRNLPTIGLVIGLITILAGTLSLRLVWRRISRRIHRAIFLILGGVCGAALSLGGQYHISETEHVIGFPFLAMEFIKKRGMWLDYLGSVTIPALVANAYVGFTLPFIVAAVWLLVRCRDT